MPADQFKGLLTQLSEITTQNLVVNGIIPGWLAGDFISNGPAQFDVGETHFNHWFDGFAMLKKFSFKSGVVQFQNRFLHSRQYTQSNLKNRLYTNEFGTYASASILGRIKDAIHDAWQGIKYDNCNVNIVKIASHYTALTESNQVIEFDRQTLTTVGAFSFQDNINWQLGTAHPQVDNASGEIVNVAIDIGRENKYYIFKIKPNTTRREIIQTYSSDRIFYMHSFSMTENYVILYKSPLTVNKWKLMLGLPFINTLYLEENKTSSFIIIDKRNGKIKEIEVSPFVCLHGANAYESNKEIILDLICYDAMNPYSNLYLENLRKDSPKLVAGALRRYVIASHLATCSESTLTASQYEFPRICGDLDGKKYHFVYCNAMVGEKVKFLNSIQKIHVQTGRIDIWKREGYYPGEPIFIAKHDARTEDDGVLLSIVYDASTQCSLLVIIDALSMQEVAEITLPLFIPLGLHGNFYPGS